MKKLTGLIYLSVALTVATNALAIDFVGGSTYSQNFDTLPATGSTTWTNGTSLGGWYAIAPLLASPTTITAQTGSSTTGLLASFGTGTATDRSLGWVYANALGAAGTSASIGFGLVNTSGYTLDTFTLAYAGEQWRTNAATPGNLVVEYKIGGTFDNSATGWTSLSALTFTGPNTTGSTAVDGNANTSSLNTTISSIAWTDTSTIWFRWRDTNDAGTDAALAIDNVTFTAVPEPHEYGIAIAGMLVALVVVRRRRANSMA